MERFEGLNTQVLGISVDHVPGLKAWADSLGGITYPLLSDFWPHGAVAETYGVLRSEGYSERALFVINRSGVLCHQQVVDIEKQPDNNQLRAVIRSVDPVAAANEPRPKRVTVALPRGGIVMYCTPWCPECKKARAWLAEQNLPYTEVDIYKVPGAEEQVREWCNGSLVTPTFDIDGQIVIDFTLEALEYILKR